MNNGNGGSSLVILALPLLLLAWMFWSANRRTKRMRQFNSALDVGDEVVTSSGIYGTIRHLDDVS
ncbi:MAG TPA: preprotein translocase subunit YajC, partial [Intrasporangium sp.]|nr:preprotein translocase subunit YajC [Intrasporangium sp.]